MLPQRADERKTREQILPSGQRIKDTGPRKQEHHVESEERVHAINERSTCGRDQSTGIGDHNLSFVIQLLKLRVIFVPTNVVIPHFSFICHRH